MTYLIAFTGKKGSGKDTAAKALTKLGWNAMAFADPLREVLAIAYGVTMEEMLDPILKEKPLDRFPYKSPRELLTTIGTQGFRDLIHEETWTKALERRALIESKVAVTDLRFHTEAEMLRSHNAVLIRVINPRVGQDDDHAKHRSETEMDEIVVDHTVINDGTIEQLHNKVIAVLIAHYTDLLTAWGIDPQSHTESF